VVIPAAILVAAGVASVRAHDAAARKIHRHTAYVALLALAVVALLRAYVLTIHWC